MCSRCNIENQCSCTCIENLAMIQSEFYPFDVIRIKCDDCSHSVIS